MVKKKNLLMILLCLLIITVPYLPQTVNNLFALTIEILLIMTFSSIYLNILENIKYVILFASAIILSTIINLGLSTRTMNALVTTIKYVLLFYTAFYLGEKYTSKYVIDAFRRFLIIMVAVADIAALITIFTHNVSSHGGVDNIYVIGNKFLVGYYHMFLLALYQLDSKNKDKVLKYSLFVGYSFFICYSIQCNTGLMGCVIVVLMRVLSIKKNLIFEGLKKPIVFCMIFIASNFILIGTDFLAKSNALTYLLTKYSHTNKILTGRVDMYLIALEWFKKSPLLGWGINSTVVEDTLTWGNAQNGLLKIMLDHGILGAVTFLLLCFDSLKYKADGSIERNMNVSNGFVFFLYGMMVCSLVEININQLFIVALALYSMSTKICALDK